VEVYPATRSLCHDGPFVRVMRELQREMQAGGNSTNRIPTEEGAESCRELRPPVAINRPRASEMAIEVPAFDEVGERELVQRR
jgi:hypothetical protein